MTISNALAQAAQTLADISDSPRLDAELLMAHALGVNRGDMLLRQREQELPTEFADLVARRLAHEPVAYIIGYRDFWDLTLRVTPDVLIPRADSETLIEAARTAFAGRTSPATILDLGTGSGALLLAALSLFPAATGIGIDASQAALAVATGNAAQNGFADRTTFLHASWREPGWCNGLGVFDLILCNPPYVETNANLARQVRDYEPASALFAGADGLDDYRMLVPQVAKLLTPDGVAIFEIGKGQEAAVSILAANAGLNAEQHRDLGGIIRALSMTKRKPQ